MDLDKILYSKDLSPEEKKKILINEFYKCKDDFFYFVDNYVKVKHPNKNIVKMNIFDFQYDIAYPITVGLKYGRTEKTKELIQKFRYRFDFKKWMREYIERRYEELKSKIPLEMEEYYTIIADQPLNKSVPDTIILKSRQTGISTILQIISLWHCNFYPNKYHIIVSYRDKDAIKYLKDIKIMYGLLPTALRCRYVKNNDHEFELVIPNVVKENGAFKVEYNEAFRSRIICQSATEVRGDPPNLLVLDEFASYEKAEKLWESAGFAVSGGGIIVIISTPKGVGNLYYKLWTMCKKTIISFAENSKNENITDTELTTPFRMAVVHWTQLPEEEFKRRGFDRPINWYNWMASKFRMEGGDEKVAQELDLEFVSSGKTFIPGIIIKKYEKDKNILELRKQPQKIDNIYIYEEPSDGEEYVISCDVSKGVGKDYSVLYVLRKEEVYPVICCEFKSNKIDTDRFGDIIYDVYRYYENDGINKVWINIEQNNHGLAVISYLLNKKKIPEYIILNSYDFKKREFKKKFKGFETTGVSRDILLTHFRNVIVDLYPTISSSLFDEIKVFIDKGKKVEAMTGRHDDHIMAYSIGIYTLDKLLPLYKQFLVETGQITVLPEVYSSRLDIAVDEKLLKNMKVLKDENNKYIEKEEKTLLHKKLSEIKEDDYLKIKFLSKEYKDVDDEFFVF